MEKKKCPECAIEFTPNRWWQEFCCTKHRTDFHNRAYRVADAKTKAEMAEQAQPKRTSPKPENPTNGSPWRGTPKIAQRNAKLRRLVRAGKLKPTMSKDEMRDECTQALLDWEERRRADGDAR